MMQKLDPMHQQQLLRGSRCDADTVMPVVAILHGAGRRFVGYSIIEPRTGTLNPCMSAILHRVARGFVGYSLCIETRTGKLDPCA